MCQILMKYRRECTMDQKVMRSSFFNQLLGFPRANIGQFSRGLLHLTSVFFDARLTNSFVARLSV